MSYTPVELRHVRVGRSLFGYNRATVEQLIEEVAQSFEATWRERGELAEKVEALEKQLEEHRERENLLTQTLLAAEQAASDVQGARPPGGRGDRARGPQRGPRDRAQGAGRARAADGRVAADRGHAAGGARQRRGGRALAAGRSRAGRGRLVLAPEKHLPPPIQEDMPGWPREDTDEFAPVSPTTQPSRRVSGAPAAPGLRSRSSSGSRRGRRFRLGRASRRRLSMTVSTRLELRVEPECPSRGVVGRHEAWKIRVAAAEDGRANQAVPRARGDARLPRDVSIVAATARDKVARVRTARRGRGAAREPRPGAA